jgi:hypothetical protein
LVDSNWFSPLAFVIWKSAIFFASEGKAMTSVVKESHCTILETCDGASTKFTQKASTEKSSSLYCHVPTPRNVGINERGSAWIVFFSMTVLLSMK